MIRTRPLAVVLVVVVLVGTLAPVAAIAAFDGGDVVDRVDPDAGGAAPPVVDGRSVNETARALADLESDSSSPTAVVGLVGSGTVDDPWTIGSLDELAMASSRVLVVAAYSRYDDSNPLENDVRKRIYDAIRRSPGTYASAVADASSTSRSTVRYHVRILESEGLVVAEKVQGKQRYFQAPCEDVELLAAFHDDETRAVLTSLDRLEDATVTELADVLDRAPSTTSYHLSRLADRDLIEQERVDGTVVNRLAAKTERELRQRTVEQSADVATSSAD